jgi:hypothetical protein
VTNGSREWWQRRQVREAAAISDVEGGQRVAMVRRCDDVERAPTRSWVDGGRCRGDGDVGV